MANKKSGSSIKNNGTPKYQPMPDLTPDEFELLKSDIAENGLQYPIIQDEDGTTLDGHQRERALRELKIKNYPVQVIGGLTEEEKWQYALSVNVKRRHLTSAQKRELIKQELKRSPDIANNWLAEIVGADVKTVQAVRRKFVATLEIPKLDKLRGKDEPDETLNHSPGTSTASLSLHQIKIFDFFIAGFRILRNRQS